MWWSEQLADVLGGCLEVGMEPPLLVAMIGRNGSVVVVRYSPIENLEFECTTLVERFEGPGMAFPIRVMIVDRNGKPAYATIGEPTRAALM